MYNPNPVAVNLAGWALADADRERHTIAADLWLAGGGYLILGRNAELTQNGGVSLAYVYTGFTLANSADELLDIAVSHAVASHGHTDTPELRTVLREMFKDVPDERPGKG